MFHHDGEINISPLIDIVFILLIFFIVTTVFVDETGLEIEKPRAATQQDIERNSILIGIDPQGAVHYNGREIGIGGVRAVVGRLLRQELMPVIIQADRRTPTDRTIAVLDEARSAGAEQVFVSTLSE
ncbi:biopolymer transporter ExbD [Pontiella sp. NLcol2]|uniref:Biopolymer transporter ExbD n=2 Tax=Pontiella agarivorans TaxID=3038953 RepID=A0ABU5MW21_9BACT|nr:biopolymer transporter ExbD [Pontiella agarivorans]